MKSGPLSRIGVASLGLAAMVTSALAFTAAAPQPSAANLLADQYAAQNGVTSLVNVKADTQELVQVLQHSFDMTEHGYDGWFHVIAHPGDIERLQALGFETEVLVEDMMRQNLVEREIEAQLYEELKENGPTDLQPGERIEGYRTWADFDADTRKLAADNPDFVKLIEFPHETHEGRTVVGLQIAAGVETAATDGRPSSLLMGLHHAREWPSAELTIMFAYDIIESYNAGDKEITDLLKNVNLYVIPVVNPDGYVRSREFISDSIAPAPGAAAAYSEFAYHRKNMRPHDSLDGLTGQGVDPNRNYPYKWAGPGTSTAESAATYHGPGPGSEPEVQNILDHLRSSNVTTLITNHTYSDLVLRPFGDTMRDTPDEELLKGHADAMAAINGYRSIKGLELYATTGTTDDWVYGFTGAFSYTFEISQNGVGDVQLVTAPGYCGGFHPIYQQCVGDFYALNRDAFILNVKQATNPAFHSQLNGTAPAGTVLSLAKAGEIPLSIPHPESGDDYIGDRLEYTMVVGKAGTFKWAVNPSPMPQTLLDIEDGFLAPSDAETYTLTATYPDGSVKVIEGILIMRGDIIGVTL